MVVVPDSIGAKSFYTKDGAVELIGGQKRTIDGKTYFSQWFNTTTGQWEDIPEVKAAFLASVPEFYPGLALSLDKFTELKSKDDIARIIAYLRSQPSLLTDGSEPFKTFVGGSNTITIECNRSGKINCAVAASVKVFDQGHWRWLRIVEMRNNDAARSRGYLTGYFYDEVEATWTIGYDSMVKNPSGEIQWEVIGILAPEFQALYPYEEHNIEQPGVSDLLDQLLKTQIIAPALESTIINLGNY